MSRPNKLLRYEQNKTNNWVLDESDSKTAEYYGKWNNSYFAANHHLVLELGCGNGDFSVLYAQQFKDKNIIGVDLKGDRIWKGSQMAIEKNLKNVAFMRSRIEMLPKIFAPHEIDEIWITFPDPWLKPKKEKHRLTNLYFLNLYQSIIKKEGWVHLKTDSTAFLHFTLQMLSHFSVKNLIYSLNIDALESKETALSICTKYEKKWRSEGVKIKYLKFQFTKN